MRDLTTLSVPDLLAEFAYAIEPCAGYGGKEYDEIVRRFDAQEAEVALLREDYDRLWRAFEWLSRRPSKKSSSVSAKS